MSNGYQPGATLVARQDVPYGNQIAFVSGEQMILHRIEPNPDYPDYKYVVYSPRVQQYMSLSDKELAPAPAGAVAGHSAAPTAASQPAQYQYTPVAYPTTKPPRNKKLIIALCVAGAVFIAAMGVTFFALKRTTQNKAEKIAQRRTCRMNLRTVTGAIELYNVEYEAYPPDGEVDDLLVPYFIDRQLTCPTSGRTYTLVAGESDLDPPTVTCPTNEPGHSL